jgi:hypothetical protein
VEFGPGRHAEPNANSNGDGNQYADSNVHTNCNSDCHGYCYSHGNGYAYSLADLNPATYSYAKVYPATKNSANSAATSVAGDDRLLDRIVPWPAVALGGGSIAFAPTGCHPERSAAESKDPVEIRLIMPRDVSTSLDMTCGCYC